MKVTTKLVEKIKNKESLEDLLKPLKELKEVKLTIRLRAYD